MQRVMRTDSEWRAVERQACRVTDFTPFASVENGEVVVPSLTDPYASVTLECTGMPSAVKGSVTHKKDFAHLWAAFKERGVADDEEVVIFWTTMDYKYWFMHFLSRFLPKMCVWICAKGALEVMGKLCDPTRDWEAGFDPMAAVRASQPIVEWKPEARK